MTVLVILIANDEMSRDWRLLATPVSLLGQTYSLTIFFGGWRTNGSCCTLPAFDTGKTISTVSRVTRT